MNSISGSYILQNSVNQLLCKSQNNVEDWISSLPCDGLHAEILSQNRNFDYESSSNVQTRRSSFDNSYFLTRKRGITGLNNGMAPSAADVYHLAISTRKARERQSRNSVDQIPSFFNGIKKNVESKGEDRAGMLRAAFAAQRLEQGNSFQSETSTHSFDSGMEFIVDDDEGNGPEEFLLELGFGGPPQGAERVPDRFLRPSQLPGIDFEKYILTHKDLEQTGDPIAWGYRGISNRRPSTMSIIMDRFGEIPKDESKRKASLSNGTCRNERSIDLLCVAEDIGEEEAQTEEVAQIGEEVRIEDETTGLENNPESCPLVRELAAPSSRKSSFSSRKSSLRRQECIDEVYPGDDLQPSPRTDDASTEVGDVYDIMESETSEEDDCQIPLPSSVQPFLPTVYVTPPPIFETGAMGYNEEPSSSTERSNTPEEIKFSDPVFAVLQLALEAYRARLDVSPSSSSSNRTSPLGSNPCDWNHNSLKDGGQLSSIRQDIRDELARTQQLLQSLHQRVVSADRPFDQSHDITAIRSVLSDMASLLQEQRRMQRQTMEVKIPAAAVCGTPTVTNDPVGNNSSLRSVTSTPKPVCNCSQPKTSWLRSMERRLTVQIRRAVRTEIRRALSESRTPKRSASP